MRVKSFLELHLDDLPESFIVDLEPSTRKKLFTLLFSKKNFKTLAKELNISVGFLYHLKNGRHAIRLKHLKNICRLSGVPLAGLEQNVSSIISNRGGRIHITFPVRENAHLAHLMGNCFGDGSISMKKREFDYVNKDVGLILKTKESVKSVFNSQPTHFKKQKDGTYKIAFSNLVGEILLRYGAPRGSKVFLDTKIPPWILNGNNEIKKAFLISIFDDDGSVLYSKKYPAKNVNLHLTRVKRRAASLNKLLCDIKLLLTSFDISSNGPYTARKYSVDGEERLVMGIFISDYRNMHCFYKKIGFRSSIKMKRLVRCLENCSGGGNYLRKEDIQGVSYR